ncbi:MAG TPA: hypothetical protein VFE32_01060 [Puia sp.]|nr:hypothetical protein [Puia sp.]
MINTTDLQEVEVSLPGDWLRKDNGDKYSFTVERMKIDDDRLFRQLHVQRRDGRPEEARYALTLEGEYCGIFVNNDEFLIRRLAKFSDGSAFMEWEDRAGGRILFERLPGAEGYA